MVRDSKELLEVEDPVVEVLTKQLGWIEIDSRKADELRPSTKEPILTELLKKKIKEINSWISDDNVNRVIRSITSLKVVCTMSRNLTIPVPMKVICLPCKGKDRATNHRRSYNLQSSLFEPMASSRNSQQIQQLLSVLWI